MRVRVRVYLPHSIATSYTVANPQVSLQRFGRDMLTYPDLNNRVTHSFLFSFTAESRLLFFHFPFFLFNFADIPYMVIGIQNY